MHVKANEFQQKSDRKYKLIWLKSLVCTFNCNVLRAGIYYTARTLLILAIAAIAHLNRSQQADTTVGLAVKPDAAGG